jgi:O-antigen/teichoic acid export membrane protein
VGNAVAVALFVAVSRLLLPGVSMRPRFDRDVFGAIARFSGFKFAGAIGGLLTYRFDQVAIGAFLGVSAAGVYVVPATAATRVVALLTDLVLPLFPRISKVTGDPAVVRSLFLRSARMMTLAAAPTFGVLFVFADAIIRSWIGGETGRLIAVEGSGTLRWLAAASLIQAIAVVPVIVSEASGKPEINNGFAVLSAIINVPLVLLLVPRLGIEGAAIAYFANSATQTVVFIFYAARRFAQVTPRQLLAESVARPMLAAGVACGVGALVRPMVTGVVTLLLALLLVAAIYVVLVRLISAITREDRDYLAAFVSHLPSPLHRLAAHVR